MEHNYRKDVPVRLCRLLENSSLTHTEGKSAVTAHWSVETSKVHAHLCF